MMNENFLKSLEEIGRSQCRRSKLKVLMMMRSRKDDALAGASISTSHRIPIPRNDHVQRV